MTWDACKATPSPRSSDLKDPEMGLGTVHMHPLDPCLTFLPTKTMQSHKLYGADWGLQLLTPS